MAVIEAIATTYLEADAATVLFEDIPTTYEHLQMHMNAASDNTAYAGYREWCYVLFNTSTATTNSDYSYAVVSARANARMTSATTGHNHIVIPWMGGTAIGMAHFGGCVMNILNYRNGSKKTTMTAFAGSVGGGTTSSERAVGWSSGLWDNVAAVTKILLIPDLGSNWRRGSEFTLYGSNSS